MKYPSRRNPARLSAGLTIVLSLLFLGFLAGFCWQDLFAEPGLYRIKTDGKEHVALSAGTGKINPNTAGILELMDLPGVGPAIADRILASREEEGPFRSAEDLLRVKGIGEKTLEKMLDYLSFDDGVTQ